MDPIINRQIVTKTGEIIKETTIIDKEIIKNMRKALVKIKSIVARVVVRKLTILLRFGKGVAISDDSI